jgi:cytochrome c5
LTLPFSIFALLLFSQVAWGSEILSSPDDRQLKLLTNNCIQCHSRPETGAPTMGVAEDWTEVRKQGEALTLINVVEGIRGMPPLGYCSACSVGDLKVLTRFISGIPSNKGGQL